MTAQRSVAGAADGLPPDGRRKEGLKPAEAAEAGAEDSATEGAADEGLSAWYPDLVDEPDAPEAGPFLGEDGELPEGIVELDDETDVPPDPAAEDSSDEAPRAGPSATPDAPAPPPRRRGKRMVKPEWRRKRTLEPTDRILALDIWQRSGLAATEFASLLEISPATLRCWRKKFEELGPEGLLDAPRGRKKGSRLPEVTKRAIIMIKESNPDAGTQRISDMLRRGPALAASPGTVARVLHEAGYVTEDVPVPSHPDKPRSFERKTPNELWQTDLFTFVMKRTNRRVYLVAFMDDHSRFVTSFAVHASASSSMVIEAFQEGIASYGPPGEVLTDNGPQYSTWRGKSAFNKECDRLGITQIVSRPRHPQTLGKIERFWQTLWRECLERAMLADLGEARLRIGHFVDYYNFQRPSQALDGLVPADRFFKAAPEVHRTLKARVAANALDLARHGEPKTPFYLTGNVGGKSFSVHAEGERILMRRGEEEPREIELTPPAPAEAESVEATDSSAEPTGTEPQAATGASESTPAAGEDASGYSFMTDNVRRIVESLHDPDKK